MNEIAIEGYPLSPQQKRIWHLQSGASTGQYRSRCQASIRGDLDLESLRKSIDELVSRYEILRTSFRSRADMDLPLQVVGSSPKVNIRTFDADHDSPMTGENFWGNDTEARSGASGDSSSFLVTAVEHSDRSWTLFLSAPALSLDGFSWVYLLNELEGIYKGICDGAVDGSGSENDGPLQYIDIAQWNNELLEEADAEAKTVAHAQWLDLDLLLHTESRLPLELDAPSGGEFRACARIVEIQGEVASGLSAGAVRSTVPLESYLLASWQTFLWLVTRISPINGVVFAGRNYEDLHGAVGPLSRSIPLAADLESGMEFNRVVEQAARSLEKLDAVQEYFTWDEFDREDGSSPFLPFCFEFHSKANSPTREERSGGEVSFAIERCSCVNDRFKLKAAFQELPDQIALEFHYDSRVITESYLDVLVDQFRTLLRNIVTEPDSAIQDLGLVSPVAQKLMTEWNQTEVRYPQKCVHELIEAQIERTPDAPAVTASGIGLSYRDLNKRANKFARYLQGLGVVTESIVGVYLERSPDLIVTLLGIMKAGAAYLPLDINTPRERLEFVLSDAGAEVLVSQKDLIEKLPEHDSAVVCVDRDWAEIVKLGAGNLDITMTSNTLAYVIYTSGSTGKPKGTLITHRSLVNYLCWSSEHYSLKLGNGTPVHASIAFDATITSLFPSLLVGQKIEILDPGEELDQLRNALLAARDYSLVKITPAHLDVLAEWLPASDASLQTRALIIGGEALKAKTLNYWRAHAPDTRLINEYGPTETVVGCCVYELDGDEPDTGEIPIGRPIANTQLYILDKKLRQVAIGITGELHIGGAGLARGYLDRTELTAEKFISNPFGKGRLYKSGDRARYRPDGIIEFLGRIDDQVKIRGFRIELGEIEDVVTSYPGIKQVVVSVRQDDQGSQQLIAHYVHSEAEEITMEELRKYLKDRLPHYMVPSGFISLAALPLTSHGKVDRDELDRLEAEVGNRAQYVPPRDDTERRLAEIWSQTLEVEWVGVRDNFFDLGGHSLLAVRLISQVQTEFELSVPLSTVFRCPTIEEFAEQLHKEPISPESSSLVAIQPMGTKPPFFCIPGAGGNVIYLYELSRAMGAKQPFFALQSEGLDGQSEPLGRVEDIAKSYVRQIRSVQAKGPYYIGGHSFGSLVAFEIARQLSGEGEKIGKVVVLDTMAPLPNRVPALNSELSETQWHSRILRSMEHILGVDLSILDDTLDANSPEDQRQLIQDGLVQAGVLSSHKAESQLRGFIQVFKTNVLSFENYVVHEAKPIRISLFRAMDKSAGAIESIPLLGEPNYGWEQLSTFPIKVQDVPGNHESMMAQPHVRELAASMVKEIPTS